jgi:hypothetical protein
MTRIKYATIGRARASDSITIFRGKKTGRIGFLPSDDEDESLFGDAVYAEEVVELPETMTPSEYSEYMEENYPEDAPELAQAVIEVAEEHDIDGVADNVRERIEEVSADG